MGRNLKETLARGDIAVGMTVYTYSPPVVEALGYWGFDFAFIDAEHTPITIDQTMDKLIMAAKLAGVAALVRVKGIDEVDIRKALEFGAEGIIVPRVRTRYEAERIVDAVKFPPEGRRGIDATVRSARYAGRGFDMEEYIKESNRNTWIIPMHEDKQFDEELDAILSVPGIDAVCFGPTDYALSLGRALFYQMDDPTIQAALSRLVSRAGPKGIGIMTPAVPPTLETARRLVSRGVNMLILGSDMLNLQSAFGTIMSECVEPLRAGK